MKVLDNIEKERTISAIDCDGKKVEMTFLCRSLGGFRDDGTRYLLQGHYFLPAEDGKEDEFTEDKFPFFTNRKYNIQYVRVIQDCGFSYHREAAPNKVTIKRYDNGYVGIPNHLYCYTKKDAMYEFKRLCEVDTSDSSLLKGFCDIMVFDNKGNVIKYKEFAQTAT